MLASNNRRPTPFDTWQGRGIINYRTEDMSLLVNYLGGGPSPISTTEYNSRKVIWAYLRAFDPGYQSDILRRNDPMPAIVDDVQVAARGDTKAHRQACNRQSLAMLPKLTRLRGHAQRWGWWRTVKHAFMRISGRWLGLHVFVVRKRDPDISVSGQCRLPGLEIRRVAPAELVAAVDDPHLGLDRGFVDDATARGDIAFGAFDGEVIVAYYWRTTTTAPHNGDLWVRVKEPFCYAYKSFTRVDYRGNGIMPAVMLFSDDYMATMGYADRIGFVATTNYSSLALGKHVGARVIGHVAYLRWFGRYAFYRSRAVSDTGFEFYQRE